MFKIKTKSTLAVGNTFSNTATIYFDYNAPIITNTYTTTVENVLAVQENGISAGISVYPNPATDFIIIDSKEKIGKVQIFDIAGRLVLTTSGNANRIDIHQLKPGTYILKTQAGLEKLVHKLLKK